MQRALSQPFLCHGDEIEVSETSGIYVTKKTLTLVKGVGLFEWQRLYLVATLKTTDAGFAASLALFLDGALAIEFETTNTDYELLSGYKDIDDLAAGTHSMEVRLKTAGATAYNDLIEIFLAR